MTPTDALYQAVLTHDESDLVAALNDGASPAGDARMGLRPIELLLQRQDHAAEEGEPADHTLVVSLLKQAQALGMPATELAQDPVLAFHQHLRQAIREAKEQGMTLPSVQTRHLALWLALGVSPSAASGEAPHALGVLIPHLGPVRFAGNEGRALLGGLLTDWLAHGLDPAAVQQAYQADEAFPELQGPLADAQDRLRAAGRERTLKDRAPVAPRSPRRRS